MTLRKRNKKNNDPKLNHPSNEETKEKADYFQAPRNLFKIALVLRILSVFLTKTFFVPDEYWQSTEVAHHQVFGYGYLTWEWRKQIRSYLYPFIFEIYFHLLKLLALDFYTLVRYGPHLIQGVLTAVYDVSVYKLALKVTGNFEAAKYSFYLNLTSWFLFYTGSRTLSNVAEMCFSTIGLSFFSFGPNNSNEVKSLAFSILFGGVGCIIRPTCFLIWVPLILVSLLRKDMHVFNLLKACLIVVPVLLVLLFSVDCYFYGSFTVVHWNFLQFNVFDNIGAFYGSHSRLWYLTQGLPVVLGVQLVFVAFGVFTTAETRSGIVLWISAFYVFIHSLIVHKEFRFLLPVVPILLCYGGQGFARMSKYVSPRLLCLLVLLLNVPTALYFGLVHQRGTIDAMELIGDVNATDKNVLFLMPCHSTPYYSYLHQNITMRFLTCEPSNEVGYVCESDRFYEHPMQWLQQEFEMNSESLVVTYNHLSQDVKTFLTEKNYKIMKSIFHTHFAEGNIGSYVHIYSR